MVSKVASTETIEKTTIQAWNDMSTFALPPGFGQCFDFFFVNSAFDERMVLEFSPLFY